MTETKGIGDLLSVIIGCLLLSLVHPGAFAQEGMIVGTGLNYIYPSGLLYDSLCNRNLWSPEEVTPLGSQMTLSPFWFSDEPQMLAFNNYMNSGSYMEGTELSATTNSIVGTVVASADIPVIPGADGYISAYMNALGNEVIYTQTTTASGIFDFQMSMSYVSGVTLTGPTPD